MGPNAPAPRTTWRRPPAIRSRCSTCRPRRARVAGRARPAQHAARAGLRASRRRTAGGDAPGPAARRRGRQRGRRGGRSARRAGPAPRRSRAGRGGRPAGGRRPAVRRGHCHASAPADPQRGVPRRRSRSETRRAPALAAVHGRRDGPSAAERRAFHLAAATSGTTKTWPRSSPPCPQRRRAQQPRHRARAPRARRPAHPGRPGAHAAPAGGRRDRADRRGGSRRRRP